MKKTIGLKIWLWPMVFLCCVSYSDGTPVCHDSLRYPRLMIGLTPSALLNVNPGIQFSVTGRINEKLSLNAEAALLFYSPVSENLEGYRLRVGPRVHYGLSNSKKPFIEFAFTHWHTSTFRESNFSRFGGLWYETIRHKTETTLLGGAIHGGIQFSKGRSWEFDFSSGFGLGGLSVRYKDFPEDAKWEPEKKDYFPWSSRVYPGKYLYPFIILHFNVHKYF